MYRSAKRKAYVIVLFLLPAAVFYAGLFLLPAVQAFWYSLFDWRGFGDSKAFIGLGNFV
jgi:ABC-type sugar transport system permease subunit